uniref:RNA-binding protein 48 n=1 Tax=Globisporangium ultimum (strain ATCC 200006 / CBS 805.95 / DAOM BR144) TaxID=431595 RepID=K3X651_GLOUD
MARDGASRTSRNVRVFTVNNESRYVVVRNIPALGVIDDLLTRFSLYGKICEYRILDHPDDRPLDDGASAEQEEEDDRFTDMVWIQYETVNNARHAKARGVQKPFFGSILRVSYAPHFETKDDTMLKLRQRRELLQRRAQREIATLIQVFN